MDGRQTQLWHLSRPGSGPNRWIPPKLAHVNRVTRDEKNNHHLQGKICFCGRYRALYSTLYLLPSVLRQPVKTQLESIEVHHLYQMICV
jgi:hypothetical protein